jgi:hypothetical protein
MSWRSWRVGLSVMLAVWGAWLGTADAAQAPQNGSDPGGIEANPITCWWRTDKSAVHIGERFTLTLTCRTAETSAFTVAPNVSEIEPTSIQLTPFDVLAGTRHEDILALPWRYFQYVYTVRLLGDEFFGQDVNIPATNIRYRIQSVGTESVEGVERAYVLPSMPIRVMSLLPAQAADIRDASRETFGDIEAHRFRSTVGFVTAAICFGFAIVLLGVAGVRVVERARKRGPAVAESLPVRTVLQGCLRELERVKAEAARGGWNPSLVARALAPFRIAGAIALSQPVTHTMVDVETPTREGQIALRQGIVRRRRALVFAPTTPDAIDRLRTAGNGHRQTAATQEGLDRIRESLLVLNAARYGRHGSLDTGELDRTLDTGSHALRRLRRARLWPVRAAQRLAQIPAALGIGAWGR